MAYAASSGFPQQSGILSPELWSPKLQIKFYERSVVPMISNTDYEGEIRDKGDTVHIRTTPNITVRDYEKGMNLTYETPEPSTVDLLIDTGHYWAWVADDVDKKQADYAYVENWTSDASEQLRIKVDTTVLANVYSDAATANKGATAGAKSSSYNLGVTGTPIGVDKTTVIDYIADMGSVLDEQNIPEEGRFLVAPAWLCNLIRKSDLKDASLSGDGTSIARNGRVGMIDRFNIYMSNLLATTVDGANTPTNMLFGHKSCLTFASQLVKSEGPIRSEATFGDKYRGLQVYGYKVVQPNGIGHFYAYKA